MCRSSKHDQTHVATVLSRIPCPESSIVVAVAKIAGMRFSRASAIVVGIQTVIVVGFALGLSRKLFPLGVPGEWEWLRIPTSPAFVDVLLALVALAAYSVVGGIGYHVLRRKSGWAREVFAVVVLASLAFPMQAVIQWGAPTGYGLARWIIALHQRGSSGYFSVASTEVPDLGEFLAEYPAWIAKQDPLHIGTHPPGLIASERLLLSLFEANPTLVRAMDDMTPESVAMAAKVYVASPPLRPADRATLVVTGALILLACSLTVVPLYALARVLLKAEHAWAAALFWPVVPSAILFQPTSDTAFPLLATLAIALAATSTVGALRRGLPLAIVTGILLGVGMQFSLVFLPVGLVVGLVLLSDSNLAWKSRIALFLTVGVGFIAATLAFWWLTKASPFAIWWWNQKNHARFYEAYPRTYWKWLVENPIELAVGLGLPAALLVITGLAKGREIPKPSLIAIAVLALLTLSGKNLSEVGRLWIPFMPTLLVGAGWTLGKLKIGPAGVAFMVFLTGVQTLILEAHIQVVYPV